MYDYRFCYKRVGELPLLIKDIQRNPYDKDGLGKPEKLKENFSGYYSRRLTSEHRLVYKIVDDMIIVVQCRYHY